MQNDTLSNDTINNRPLPKWLIEQKSGLKTTQPQKIVMREDHSLEISFIATTIFILLVVTILTVYILKKHKKQIQ
jgi:heme/copper-type cytochrome/quinol oxidase subunit 2